MTSVELSFEFISVLVEVELAVFHFGLVAVSVGGEMVKRSIIVVGIDVIERQKSSSESRRVHRGVFGGYAPINFLTFWHVTPTNVNRSILVVYPSTNDGSWIEELSNENIWW